MRSALGRYLAVAGGALGPPGKAAGHRMHALHRLEDRLHPPEAAAGKDGDLLVLTAGDVLRRRRDRHRAFGGGGGDRRQQQNRSGETEGEGPFQHAPSKLAIVGDVLFQGSIGRTDFPKGNHQDLIDAITGRLWPLGGETVFVPGHGQPSNFAHERRTNPFVSDAALAGR